MTPEIESFFQKQEEPNKSTFLFLKDYIKNYHPDIELYFKWKLPYLYLKKKPLCYIWKDKKTEQPYLGFSRGSKIEHPALVTGDRTAIKILPVPNNQDIDIHTISEILDLLIPLY